MSKGVKWVGTGRGVGVDRVNKTIAVSRVLLMLHKNGWIRPESELS